MSAPMIWIGIPVVGAIALWLLQSKRRITVGIAVVICAALALLAWQVPFGAPIKIGAISFEINTTLVLFGRKFILDATDRTLLILTYSSGAIWFFGSDSARTNRFFIPAGLLFLGLMIAAQAVEPFLYAALLIEIAILISVPILVPARAGQIRGIQRYIVFQTFALPFILLSGWLAGEVISNSSSASLLTQAALFLAMGLALWLAVFPLNTWIPILASESHPYSAGFILTALPTAIFFLAITFLDTFAWLRTNPVLPTLLKVGGVVTVVTSGIWAAFQHDLKRLFGYGIVFENGFVLLALGFEPKLAMQLYTISIVPRLMGFATWSLALSVMEKNEIPLTLDGIKGSLQKLPVASIALIAAYFSTGGLPLLAGYPARQVTIENVAESSASASVWIFVGMVGFLIGGIRMLIQMVNTDELRFRVKEGKLETLLLGVGLCIIIGMGLIPR